MRRGLTILFVSLLILASCTTAPVESYQEEKPVLDLPRYFAGTIDGWGMFQDRSGKVRKRFYVRIEATWKDNVGTFDEHFEWSDGKRTRRVWTVIRVSDHEYTGTASDVIGTAKGEAYGNALRWRYVLNLEVDGRETYEVDFDDWMYLIDDRTMLNRSFMSKFGVELGQVTLSFTRRGA
ncbi:MAG: DUF3833 domain-containing protein [Burkholderiales bacterium]